MRFIESIANDVNLDISCPININPLISDREVWIMYRVHADSPVYHKIMATTNNTIFKNGKEEAGYRYYRWYTCDNIKQVLGELDSIRRSCIHRDKDYDEDSIEWFVAYVSRSRNANIGLSYHNYDYYVSENWVTRELCRFVSGQYVQVPWFHENWWINGDNYEKHLGHLSKEHKGMIAYTPTESKGEKDKQLRQKVGRYLRKFYGIENSLSLAEYSAQAGVEVEPVEILFATTPNECERVYLNGPNSCMSHQAEEYSTDGIHPSRNFGKDIDKGMVSDLQVAYIRRGSKITARTVVWPERKQYVRVYGDTFRMERGLTKLGYHNGSLEGAKLNKIPCGNGRLVCMYLDGATEVTIRSDHILIDCDGEHTAESVSGVIYGSAEDDRPCCERCSDRMDDGDYTYVENEHAYWCLDCIDSATERCEVGEYRFSNTGDAVILHDGRTVDGTEVSTFYCVIMNEEYLSEDRAGYSSELGEVSLEGVEAENWVYNEDKDVYLTPKEHEAKEEMKREEEKESTSDKKGGDV